MNHQQKPSEVNIQINDGIGVVTYSEACPWCHKQICFTTKNAMEDHAKVCPFFSHLVKTLEQALLKEQKEEK